MDESLYEFVYSCGCEAEFATPRVSELNMMIEAEATKRTEKMVDERFIERKKEFQLEVIKQVQEEGIRKEGLKISASSPLISDTYIVDGIEVFPEDYIPNTTVTDPLYEETILTKNEYSLEYQEYNNKTGKRKFVWKNPATSVLISNPVGVGKCKNIVVFLKGKTKPVVFPGGVISIESFRKQTGFARKGVNSSVPMQFESFMRDLRECPNKKFLMIPDHAGGVTLPNGETTYISADSIIPGLEDAVYIRTPKQRVRDSLKVFDEYMYGVIRDTRTEKSDGAA